MSIETNDQLVSLSEYNETTNELYQDQVHTSMAEINANKYDIKLEEK